MRPDSVADAAVTQSSPETGADSLLESYRRLAEVFHDVLSEQSLDSLLDRIADTLADLIPYEALAMFEADEGRRLLTPVLARDQWAEQMLAAPSSFGEGITGWAVERREPVHTNDAHRDPRARVVPGTPAHEPEALISVPLIARGAVMGALNIYRLGEDAAFSAAEFELAQRFGDAAALALDNAHIRARLEREAQTDSLTGLYNHRHFHERLRAELMRASRSHDSVALLMLDIDEFKRVNDVYGHGTGDEVLRGLAELLRTTLRASDVVCRLGGEEFGVIMPSCDSASALGLAARVSERLTQIEFGPAGNVTVSAGVAQGLEHATSPRELVACAEAAMMTAKARGRNQIVLFDEAATERPGEVRSSGSDPRSIAHLKMLQSLGVKLNRLSEVSAIGETIASELRMLIDYHNCRISMVEEDQLVPIAFRGHLDAMADTDVRFPTTKLTEGITGHVARNGVSLLLANAMDCEFATLIPGTQPIEESMIAVPLRSGARVIGTIVITKLGVDQFDADDVRLLEVLSGHASVALENARLYEAQRREAENLKALLELTRAIADAPSRQAVAAETVAASAGLLGAEDGELWLRDSDGGFECVARTGRGRRKRMDWRIASRLLEGRRTPFLVPGDASRRSLAVAPLVDGSRVEGWIAVRSGDRPTDERVGLLEAIAAQAVAALARAGSLEQLERTFLATIETLAGAGETGDPHWITETAVGIGAKLGLEGAALKELELGALFHDIGKLAVPAALLFKPGPLTAEERTVIEAHPELGEQILEPIAHLSGVRAIVRSCRERWDGRGYPDRKADAEIPLAARIILVCDAFQAMTSDRPYRQRVPVAEARRRLREGAGTQFDPGVVDVFLELPDEVLAPERDVVVQLREAS